MAPQSSTLSRRGWRTTGWILIASVQYGWQISALNQIQTALTCRLSPNAPSASSRLPSCIPMNNFAFSVATSAFTVGGLLGSIAANRSATSLGRKASLRIQSGIVLIGSIFMTFAASVPPLVFGRLLVGAGSGLGLCVVPLYLSEISPPAIKGSVGVLNQLGIVLGILITQALGIVFAAPSLWRVIPFIAAALALAQLLLGFLAIDSPAWLTDKARLSEARTAASLLWGERPRISDPSQEEEGPLLKVTDTPGRTADPPTLRQLFKPPLLRPLVTVSLGMIAQQISGINAVLYYSNDILSHVIPNGAAYVSLGVTVVNALMTFPAIYLIERIGRRSLITLSTFGAILSLICVGYGLDGGHVVLASVGVLTFVASFAIGLGPVPFVIIPDISPFHAVSTFSSIALSLNWIANFIVGIGFLPLRSLLADGEKDGQGRVFYVFATTLFVVYLGWSRAYKV